MRGCENNKMMNDKDKFFYGGSIEEAEELNNFDLSNLDFFEERMYNHFIKHSSKVEALQVIINTVEGDFSQLSPELAKIAEKYNTEYKTGGAIKKPRKSKYEKAIKQGDDDINRTVLSISELPKEKKLGGKNYILVGSEMYTSDADKLAEELKQEGYDARAIDQKYKYLDKHPHWNKQRRTGIVGAVYRSVDKIMKDGGRVGDEITYKGKHIEKLFPSGMYQFYSDSKGRFLKSDDLDNIKSLIDSEVGSYKNGGIMDWFKTTFKIKPKTKQKQNQKKRHPKEYEVLVVRKDGSKDNPIFTSLSSAEGYKDDMKRIGNTATIKPIYQEGGTIDSERRFTEGDFNKLTDNGFEGKWNGSVWEIYQDGGGKVLGKFNPHKNTLFIAGNKDLSNPLVKYLQENSLVSSDEYYKLRDGGTVKEYYNTRDGRHLYKNKEAIWHFYYGTMNDKGFAVTTSPSKTYKKESGLKEINWYKKDKNNYKIIREEKDKDGNLWLIDFLDITDDMKNTISFQTDDLYKNGGGVDEYTKGGFVGKSELVWRKLTDSEKLQFLYENFTPEITPRSQELLVGKAYNFLPKNVKIVLNSKYANVEEYAKGSTVKSKVKEVYYQPEYTVRVKAYLKENEVFKSKELADKLFKKYRAVKYTGEDIPNRVYVDDKFKSGVLPPHPNQSAFDFLHKEQMKKYGLRKDGGDVSEHVYKLGDKYRGDFDYDGMLRMGLKANLSWGYDKLVKLHNSFEDVNYHSASKPLWEAIQNLKSGNKELAESNILEFHSIIIEMDDNENIDEDGKELLFNMAYQLQNADEGWINNHPNEFIQMQNDYKEQFTRMYGHSNYIDPFNIVQGKEMKDGGGVGEGKYYSVMDDGTKEWYNVKRVEEVPYVYFAIGNVGNEPQAKAGEVFVHRYNALRRLYKKDGSKVKPMPQYAGKEGRELAGKEGRELEGMFDFGGAVINTDTDLAFDRSSFHRLKERQKAFVGYLGDVISIQTAETFLGRKINSWTDDVIILGDTAYRKVYLRPEYKQIN